LVNVGHAFVVVVGVSVPKAIWVYIVTSALVRRAKKRRERTCMGGEGDDGKEAVARIVQ